MLRDFLQRSLYDADQGYFTAARDNAPVGGVGKVLAFPQLAGEDGYRRAVREAYDRLEASWLTPSEIFTPYYGRAIANFILDKHSQMAEPGSKLSIVEIGGGTGTLARDVLDHVRSAAPQSYAECSYTSVEISPQLAQVQQHTVADIASHASCYEVECRDAGDPAGWSSTPDLTFILMMEVLDNCPHDRIHRSASSGDWQQTHVVEDTSQSRGGTVLMREQLQPLRDELIQRCMSTGPWEYNGKPLWHRILDFAMDAGAFGAEQTIFLPTKCLSLLEVLCKARPHHCILAADFDELPETTIAGKNAPLVASTEAGVATDHASYLLPPGTADIFFPTDFQMLDRMYGSVAKAHGEEAGLQSSVLKSREFMKRYASLAETTCAGGYNPLLQDFKNTSFFIGQRFG
ncbi:g361 [Coccomyxa viridis]|uniref:Protein arginine methyltransferase NDUFAF7 n=1 Tax=Coccomyxa viridis TaxID=1274662 RepID=A0ABP1FM94_9CHLO